MNTAYIVSGYRSAVGKSGKGVFRFTRPDDLAADVVKHLVKSVPNLDNEKIDDVIKKINEFLEKGHRVEVNLFLKGREKAHKDWGRKKMQEFMAKIEIPYITTMQPKYAGRGFVTQIAKK